MVTVKIKDDDILRDGETHRIHMMARDSSTQKTPVEIAIAATKAAMAGFNDGLPTLVCREYRRDRGQAYQIAPTLPSSLP
jgi:hypothetical protein